MRLLSDLWSDRSFRWELLVGLLLTIGAVAGGAWSVAMPWPAAVLIGLVYVGMYPVLALTLRRENVRRVRRLLLIGWGLFLWLGLVVGALTTRGTTAYTAEVSYSTMGTPICNIGNLWIITGLLTRNKMLLGTTMLGFATTTAAWLGLTLAFGRGWCGWYCYLGVPLEIAALLRKRRGRGKLAQDIRWNRLPPQLGYFRYAVLLAAVLLSAWLVTPVFCYICPIRVLFDQWELRFDLLNIIRHPHLSWHDGDRAHVHRQARLVRLLLPTGGGDFTPGLAASPGTAAGRQCAGRRGKVQSLSEMRLGVHL
jgi:hypothetical protein